MNRCVLLAPFVLAATLAPAAAKDHFLTIGGGYSPSGNQVSLEKNVRMFQDLLREQYREGAPHDLFFADGDNPQRDLQFIDPDFQIPRANLLLARVFRGEKALTYQYRNHELPGVNGITSRENLERWFDETGAQLQAGDRLFIYVTAHGGRSTDKKNAHNTGLYLWNTQRLPMTDFARQLDKLPDEVPVVVVMVQCYSGGFANIVFHEGDPANGATTKTRCGFFATVHTRPAAGCTPDINEENYQEYSSFFWAALRGKARVTETPLDCDYDQDGRVSLAEAHTYALLASSTIDISVKTSDAFLRHFSRTEWEKPKPQQQEDPKKAPAGEAPAADEVGAETADAGQPQPSAAERPQLLTPDAPLDELLASANPLQKALVQGLSEQLGLSRSERAQEAREAAAEFKKQQKQLDEKYKQKTADLNRACREISQSVSHRWPELQNRWHPRASEILSRESHDIVQLIESHERYSAMQQLHDELEQLTTERLDLDRKWAKCQRLLRELENLALASNLPAVADEATQRRYAELLAAEASIFGPAAATAAAEVSSE